MDKTALRAKAQAVIRRLSSLTTPQKPILAVDIGTTSIKIAGLAKSEPSQGLQYLGLKVLDPRQAPLEEEEKKTFFGREIRALFQAVKAKSPLVSTNISGSSVIVREAKLPALPPEELQRTLAFEAEPFIPFDVKEVNLDYHIISDILEEGQNKFEIILIAAKKDLIEGRLETLKAAGANPAVVDIDAFALCNLLTLIPSSLQETVVIANIGATITNLAVSEKGTPRVVRDVVVAGGAFTKAVQNSLNIDPDAADKAKVETGILADDTPDVAADPQKSEISQVLKSVAADLLTEISKSIDFFLTHGSDRTIHKIYLTGGGALLKNLIPFAAGQFKLPVELLNPFDFLRQPPGSGIDHAQGPAFSVVCGLALRRWNDWMEKRG